MDISKSMHGYEGPGDFGVRYGDALKHDQLVNASKNTVIALVSGRLEHHFLKTPFTLVSWIQNVDRNIEASQPTFAYEACYRTLRQQAPFHFSQAKLSTTKKSYDHEASLVYLGVTTNHQSRIQNPFARHACSRFSS